CRDIGAVHAKCVGKPAGPEDPLNRFGALFVLDVANLDPARGASGSLVQPKIDIGQVFVGEPKRNATDDEETCPQEIRTQHLFQYCALGWGGNCAHRNVRPPRTASNTSSVVRLLGFDWRLRTDVRLSSG